MESNPMSHATLPVSPQEVRSPLIRAVNQLSKSTRRLVVGKKGGSQSILLTLVGCTTGTTCLALPSAFSYVGVIPGLIAMLLAALVNLFSCYLLICACDMVQEFTYETLAKRLLGKSRSIINFFVIFILWGTMCSQLIVLADSLSSLAHTISKSSVHTNLLLENNLATPNVLSIQPSVLLSTAHRREPWNETSLANLQTKLEHVVFEMLSEESTDAPVKIDVSFTDLVHLNNGSRNASVVVPLSIGNFYRYHLDRVETSLRMMLNSTLHPNHTAQNIGNFANLLCEPSIHSNRHNQNEFCFQNTRLLSFHHNKSSSTTVIPNSAETWTSGKNSSKEMNVFAYGGKNPFFEEQAAIATTSSIWNDLLNSRSMLTFLAIGIIVIPLSLLKDMRSLRFAGALSVYCFIFVVIAIIIRGTQNFIAFPQSKLDIRSFLWSPWGRSGNKDIPTSLIPHNMSSTLSNTTSSITEIEGFMHALPIFLFAFGCQIQVAVLYEVLNDRSVKRMFAVLKKAHFIEYLGLSTIGVFGCLAFPAVAQWPLKSDVLDEFGEFDILMMVTRSVLCLIICLVIPLLVLPCRMALSHLLHRCGVNVESMLVHILQTLFIIISGFAFSIKVPNITLVIGLTGSSAGVALLWIFPSIYYLKARALRLDQRRTMLDQRPIIDKTNEPTTYGTNSMECHRDHTSFLESQQNLRWSVDLEYLDTDEKSFGNRLLDIVVYTLIIIGVIFSVVCTTHSLIKIITYHGSTLAS